MTRELDVVYRVDHANVQRRVAALPPPTIADARARVLTSGEGLRSCSSRGSTIRPIHETLRATVRPWGVRPEVRLGEDDLAKVTPSVRLIWGERDPFGSPHVGERAVAALPRGELRTLPTGHLPWLSRPVEVAELTADLATRASGPG